MNQSTVIHGPQDPREPPGGLGGGAPQLRLGGPGGVAPRNYFIFIGGSGGLAPRLFFHFLRIYFHIFYHDIMAIRRYDIVPPKARTAMFFLVFSHHMILPGWFEDFHSL